MDDVSISVFVDESGSDIISNTDPNDRYYVSVGVVLPSGMVSIAQSLLESISVKFNNGAVLKSSKIGTNNKRRIALLEMIREVPFQYFAFAVDSQNIDANSGYKYRNSFYKNVNKHLYELIARSAVGCINVTIDSHGGTSFQESAKHYFERKLDFYRTINFDYASDQSNRLIQLADIIAGSIRILLIEGATTESLRIRQLLRDKEIIFQKWPVDYRGHLLGSVNVQDIDKKIERVMFERINVFLNMYSDSDNEYDILRIKVLNRLIDAYYLDEGCIYADELRDMVNVNREKPIGDEAFRSSIIGGIRKEGIIVAGTKKGYKLATTVGGVAEYLNHNQRVIMPMLYKLGAARRVVKTSTEYDILMGDEYHCLKTILDALGDDKLFSGDYNEGGDNEDSE